MTQDTLKAATWMIGAICAFTIMAIAGRAVSFELDTFEIMLYRSLIGVVLVVSIAKASGTLGQVNRNHLGTHALRNMAHFTGQNLWFFAITVLPLAQVFAFEFTTPIWVLLLSPLLLGERITRIGAIAALIGFVGVLVVARPDPLNLNTGTIAAASAAVAFAFTAIFTRRLTKTQSITAILFWLTVMQAAFGVICAGIDGAIMLPSAATLPWLIAIGVAGLTAHFCMTTALSIAPANIVMPIDFARLPVIMLVGWWLYDEGVDGWIIVGAILILAGNYLNLTQGALPGTRAKR